MKKILALMLVLVMMLSFVSCTKKAEFFEENLEEADYEVEVTDDEDVLEELAEEMEIDGGVKYMVTGVLLDLDITNILDSEGEYISIICFEKKSDAKDKEEEAKEDDEDMVVERKGKILIIASSEEAIDAAYGK